MTENRAEDADVVYHGVLPYAKVGLFATIYFGVLAFVYVSIVSGLPSTFPLRVTPAMSPTAPKLVVPTLLMFAIAVGIAREAHLPTEAENA